REYRGETARHRSESDGFSRRATRISALDGSGGVESHRGDRLSADQQLAAVQPRREAAARRAYAAGGRELRAAAKAARGTEAWRAGSPATGALPPDAVSGPAGTI